MLFSFLPVEAFGTSQQLVAISYKLNFIFWRFFVSPLPSIENIRSIGSSNCFEVINCRRHDDGASASVLETVAVSEGEEIVGNDFELDDFEEESLYNFMQNAGKVANFNQAYNGGALSNNANSVFSRMPSNDSLTLGITSVIWF